MPNTSLLSRRSLLKASSFLAAVVAVAPVDVVAAPAVPSVLTTLLAEYAAAAEGVKQSCERFTLARLQRDDAIDNARLWFLWPGGKFQRLGEHCSSLHPDYALQLLRDEKAKCVAASDDAEAAREVRSAYAKAERQVRRLRLRYDAVIAGTDYPAALHAEILAAQRFNDARKAVCAYRPETMPEVAAILRCMTAVGQWPGTHTGVTFYDLADMLDAAEVA